MSVLEKEFYNPEKEKTEIYKKKKVLEKIKIREINDLVVVNTYWEDPDGELCVDFDNPTENKDKDFIAYRKRVNYMQPSEIKGLRAELNLSIRDFAEIIGIGFSNLSKIENNKVIQTKYQDNLFKYMKDNVNTFKNKLNEYDKSSENRHITAANQKDYKVKYYFNVEKNSSLSTFSFDNNMLGDAA